MIYPNGDIEYNKGDTETFRFNAKKNGVSCNLSIGDTYFFSVKRDKRESTPIKFQKSVTIKEEKDYFDITISKEDVIDCCCGDYVYDIRCRSSNGDICTPRESRKFRICEVIGTNV